MVDIPVSTVIGLAQIPPEIRDLSALDKVDYADAYTVATPNAPRRTAEDWARVVLEQTSLGRRARAGWRMLGLQLGPKQSPDHVQGWMIADRGEGWIRLETASWNLTAEAICRTSAGTVTLAVLVRYDHALVAAPMWAAVTPTHQHGVPVLLRQALLVDAATHDPTEGAHCS